MTNSHPNTIKEIAQQLDCGFDCFLNLRTNEIVAIPNFGQLMDEDEFRDAFGEEIKKVANKKTDFIKFEVLEGFESFKIMERFVEELTDKNLQLELKNVLANKKPFQNFKHLIDHSEFRQRWFNFKQTELEKRVEAQLKIEKQAHNI
ncbi:MAG: UPF0158 family protein [Winogradskyella sp.]|uniref:UPF0158 family protein n=1 Tax=Winogradskyella sp. TaxID=1883156 RepID=UPI00385F7DBE